MSAAHSNRLRSALAWSLAALALAALVSVVVLPERDRPRGPGAVDRTPAAEAADPVAATPLSAPEIAADPSRRADGRPRPTASFRPPDGRPVGHIRGRVLPLAGSPLPTDLVVRIGPSPTLAGSHLASEHELAVGPDGVFDRDELPLAGYLVVAAWPGGLSDERHVLLRPGAEQAALTLQLRRAASVGGLVVDADGAAVESIVVELAPVPEGPGDDRVAARVETDRTGRYRFEGVRDGAYRLLVGPPSAPAVEAVEVTVSGLDQTLPPIETPRLGRIELTVVDPLGAGLAGVEVHGFGSEGGVIRGTSDDLGELTATLLPPGDYRLRANDPRFGRGQVTVTLREGVERLEAELRLEP